MITRISRRDFVKLGATAGALAGLGRIAAAQTSQPADYKALVCVFLYGGNDGHNMVVPTDAARYTAYQTARGALALPPSKLLPIATRANEPFALHYGLPKIQGLYNQGHAAVLANVGTLVGPTLKSQLSTAQLPAQLFSHADQLAQMQTAVPGSFGTGWGGRVADAMQTRNAGSVYPPAVSIGASSLFCTGNAIEAAGLQPGNNLAQDAMSFWPASAAAARSSAQQSVIDAGSAQAVVQAANGVMGRARQLNSVLASTSGSLPWSYFPQTTLGRQLAEVARIINLRSTLAIGRQVFFCSLGGFDTHSGQDWQQWDLFLQLDAAVEAFYHATSDMGIADRVTTFTASDFGRTLQPSGTGSDHGWGSHHLLIGGAVKGGDIYGTFPTPALGGSDDANTRGVLIPTTSVAQMGSTLATWFGATPGEIDGIFQPTIGNFGVKDLGFMLP